MLTVDRPAHASTPAHRPPYSRWPDRRPRPRSSASIDVVDGPAQRHRPAAGRARDARRERPGRRVPAGRAQRAAPRVHRATPAARSGTPSDRRCRRASQQWKNALLDLSLRNRLINFTDRRGLGCSSCRTASSADLEDLVHDERRSQLLPVRPDRRGARRARGRDAARDLPQDQLAELLDDARDGVRRRHARARTRPGCAAWPTRPGRSSEETGANNLYLALGSLVWELDGRPLRSPLVLVRCTWSTPARGSAPTG